jgi:hypothetical protein
VTNDDAELTPEEQQEFRNLPRDATPPAFLWERIVRPLREDGTLLDPAARASIAASLLLLVSGTLLGYWMVTRSTERAFLAVREQDAAQLAERVQATGTAYVSALAALGDLRPVLDRGVASGTMASDARAISEVRQGREAAFAALYGAAVELARLAPGDPDVTEVLRLLEGRRFGGSGAATVQHTVRY